MAPAIPGRFAPSTALYPFASRWFDSAQGHVHYLDEGAGRPILLVHGNPTWSFLYRKLIPLLSAGGLRCIAPDLLGHGLSEHPEDFGYTAAEHAHVLQALMQGLNLNDVIVFGQDWGGPISLWAAVQQPSRVRGLVLGYTFAWPTTHWFVWCIARFLGSDAGQRQIAGPLFIERVLRMQLCTALTPEEMRHYTAPNHAPVLRRSLQALARDLLASEPWLRQLETDVRTRLGGKPALLFSGGAREWLVGRPTRHFQDMLPGYTVVPLARSGHFFQEDNPRDVAAAILRWVDAL